MTAELLGGEGVADKVATEPTVLDRDADAEQARISEVGPVFIGEAGIAVVVLAALGDRGSEPAIRSTSP